MRSARIVTMVLAGWMFGCGKESPTPPADGSSPPRSQGLCTAKKLVPWSRGQLGVGGAVTFNEIMYHPTGAAPLEWIELYNPMSISVDLSGFRIDGAVDYAFPNGTRIAAGGFLVVGSTSDLPVSIGPFTGRLPDDRGTIELWNNAGRLLDAVGYTDVEPWPVISGGSGASLAKRAPDTASGLAEAWTHSARAGGTPGAANFPAAKASTLFQTLVPLGARWRHWHSATAPDAGWASPDYDDSAWPDAPAAFFVADPSATPVAATAKVTADNYFAVYVGGADGNELKLVGRDAVGDWTSAETLSFQAGPDDHVYIAAWEAPGNHGGPQMLIGQVALPDGTLLSTDTSTFEWALGPADAAPGGALTDPAPTPAQIQGVIAKATWATPQVAADRASPPWGGALSGAFAPATRFVWADTFADSSASNVNNTFVLFRSKATLIPRRGATAIDRGPTTTYFRTRFQAKDSLDVVTSWLDVLVDDGAVFHLNGVEVLRVRMPAGPVGPATLASSAVADASLSLSHFIDAKVLTPGENVLAVEVHQATIDDDDLRFDASLRSWVTVDIEGNGTSGLAFNEVGGASSDELWLELANRGSTVIDVGGRVIASTNGAELVLPSIRLAPGGLMVLTQAELGFGARVGDKLFLYDADRAGVADGITVVAVPRARSASTAEWRYPDLATPGDPNILIEHDEIVINEIMYHAPPVAAPAGSFEKSSLEWIELYNRSTQPVDVGGFQLVDAVAYEIRAGTVMPPGGTLVVTNDVAAMAAAYPGLSAVVGDFSDRLADSGDHIVLRDACGNTADAVRYHDGGRWPGFADGGGSSLELRNPLADNAAAESWAASDEATATSWQTVTYEGVVAPSSVGPDGAWHELVVGLLDAGVVLLDDVSVVVDPATTATELVGGGTFEAGPAGFRLLGNHRHSEVIVDPTNPANHVLRLVATGPTEHMHNHLETTLTDAHQITNGRAYRISLRARWEAGSNQLSTRLYFNRLARTTTLAVPAQYGSPGAPNRAAEAHLGPTYRDLHHAPVVPKPGEPVVVSILAADPDGVAGLTLWYAVDGGALASVPMTRLGGGGFSAMLAGQPASSVVQFYVAGDDMRGASSTFPAHGPASRALWKVDDGQAAKNGLHNVRIVMTPADTAWLFESRNLMSNDRVGATVVSDELEAYYDVGVRLKGSERGRPEVVRVGFALRFQPEHPFRGIHQSVMVDRSQGVGFGQRELFFLQAMNHAGSVTSQYDDLIQVLAPRPEHTGPAHLQLARFGSLFLDYQFDDGGDGGLFEYELIYYPRTTDDGTPTGSKIPQPDSVVGTPIRDLGDDEEAYRLPFMIKNNRWRDDYRDFIRFAKVFGQSGDAFDAQVGDVIDVDEWLRAFAFATLSGAVDNYGHGDAHNAEFYFRPADGRVLYFPHDLDFLGSSRGPVVASGDLAKIIATPERARAYYGHLYDIISTSYNGTYMAFWSDQFDRLLPGQNFAGHLAYIVDRADWVMNTAPNALLATIPRVELRITTHGGADFTVATPTVVLDGQGWIDVHQVVLAGASDPLVLTWTSQSAWQATLPLGCGVNAIGLNAFDRHGQAIGSDAIGVTRTGAGCP
jgi:hypothetical protein